MHTFQLHPGAWHFAAGHIPKLELLSQDAPYGRASNGQFTIAVSELTSLPVHAVPGAPGTPPEVTPPVVVTGLHLPRATRGAHHPPPGRSAATG